MQKIITPVRPEDETKVQTDSFLPQTGYWPEDGAYQITSQQASDFRAAAASLMTVYRDIMDVVTSASSQYADCFVFTGNKNKDRKIYEFASHAWRSDQFKSYILDRWYMAWDGISPPKLLQRNFGDVGLITVTASVQEDYIQWLANQKGWSDVQSFGHLQSCFVNTFRRVADECGIPANSKIAVTAPETGATSEHNMVKAYEILCRWIKRAGYDPLKIEIRANGLFYANGSAHAFITMPGELRDEWQHELEYRGNRHGGQIIDACAKIRIAQNYCFPFAFFDGYAISKALSAQKPPKLSRNMADVLSKYRNSEVHMFYPPWSLLMGHKALLPILYGHNPDHPNLLPAYFSSGPLTGSRYIVKPVNSCQGIGSKIVSETGQVIASYRYQKKQEKYPHHLIYQQYASACEDRDGGFRVFHVFTTNGEAAALGARAAPAPFVGGEDAQTKYMPVLVRNDRPRSKIYREKTI